MPTPIAPVTFRKAISVPVGRDQLLNTLEYFLAPLVLSLSLWGVALAHIEFLSPRYVILSLLVFSLTFPGSSFLGQSYASVARHIFIDWLAVSSLLFVMGYASGYLRYFDLDVLTTWWWVAPLAQLATHFLLRW